MFRVEGVEIPVVRLTHIVTSKAKANRPKDRLFLETHAEALKDLSDFDLAVDVLERYARMRTARSNGSVKSTTRGSRVPAAGGWTVQASGSIGISSGGPAMNFLR